MTTLTLWSRRSSCGRLEPEGVISPAAPAVVAGRAENSAKALAPAMRVFLRRGVNIALSPVDDFVNIVHFAIELMNYVQ